MIIFCTLVIFFWVVVTPRVRRFFFGVAGGIKHGREMIFSGREREGEGGGGEKLSALQFPDDSFFDWRILVVVETTALLKNSALTSDDG